MIKTLCLLTRSTSFVSLDKIVFICSPQVLFPNKTILVTGEFRHFSNLNFAQQIHNPQESPDSVGKKKH
jgi:hypothetical protein